MIAIAQPILGPALPSCSAHRPTGDPFSALAVTVCPGWPSSRGACDLVTGRALRPCAVRLLPVHVSLRGFGAACTLSACLLLIDAKIGRGVRLSPDPIVLRLNGHHLPLTYWSKKATVRCMAAPRLALMLWLSPG